jgi:hypothetical protein
MEKRQRKIRHRREHYKDCIRGPKSNQATEGDREDYISQTSEAQAKAREFLRKTT